MARDFIIGYIDRAKGVASEKFTAACATREISFRSLPLLKLQSKTWTLSLFRHSLTIRSFERLIRVQNADPDSGELGSNLQVGGEAVHAVESFGTPFSV
jgi:hypothetical protein